MSRKVTVNVTFRLTLNVDDGVEISDTLNELDYTFTPPDYCEIVDEEMIDFDVTNSR